MNEHTVEVGQRALEERSRALFHESVESIDMAMRSRLTRARHAALAVAERPARRTWLRMPFFAPALGMSAAAVLGIALWFGTPLIQHGAAGHHSMVSADTQSNLEDLDIVAASDEGAGDPMEMLQDDVAFYDWADKAASSEPAA